LVSAPATDSRELREGGGIGLLAEHPVQAADPRGKIERPLDIIPVPMKMRTAEPFLENFLKNPGDC
jgi:hypothetical protein